MDWGLRDENSRFYQLFAILGEFGDDVMQGNPRQFFYAVWNPIRGHCGGVPS